MDDDPAWLRVLISLLKLAGMVLAAGAMIAGTFAAGGYVIWKWLQRLAGR